MLRYTLRLLPLIVLLGACSADDTTSEEVVVTSVSSPDSNRDMEAPPIDPKNQTLLATLDGEALALNAFSGQYVLLNYWATWCAPCIEEIPALLNAGTELGEDYQLLLVSDEPADAIKDFLADNDFEGDFIRLTSNFASHGVRAVPSTVLYGPDGSPVKQWLGARVWDSPEMLAEIRAAQ